MREYKKIADVVYFLQHHNKNMTKEQEQAINDLAEKIQDLHTSLAFLGGRIERGEEDLYCVSCDIDEILEKIE